MEASRALAFFSSTLYTRIRISTLWLFLIDTAQDHMSKQGEARPFLWVASPTLEGKISQPYLASFHSEFKRLYAAVLCKDKCGILLVKH